MSDAELAWVNAYNAECLHKVGPLLAPAALAWLQREAAPVKR